MMTVVKLKDFMLLYLYLEPTTYMALNFAGLAPLTSHSLATVQKKSNRTNFAGSKIEQLPFSWPD